MNVDYLICPKCGLPLNEKERIYLCSSCSFKVWKTMSGRNITQKELDQLREKGETEELEFKSSSGKEFTTTLVMVDNKVDYGFNVKKTDSRSHDETVQHPLRPNTVNIRVESDSPGKVNIEIVGLPKEVKMEISYGIESSRKSECLGCITAAYYVKWILKDTEKVSLNFSINNLEFANYLLNEMTPRDKSMQCIIYYAWSYFKNFKSWKATYQHKKRQRLEGSNTSDTFPRGVFPWLNTDIIEGEDYIGVILPANPAVYTQFKASFHNAVLQDQDITGDDDKRVYKLPKGAIKAVNTWISMVKNK